MELPEPFIVYHRSINVYWNFNLYWHFNLHFFLYFYRSVDIDRFVNKNWLVDYHWFFVDRFVNEHLLFNDLGYLDLFDNNLRYFLLDLDILRNLYYLLYNSFRSRNVLRDLHLDLDWLLKH